MTARKIDTLIAAKLRKLADNMVAKIENLRRPQTQNPTPKRTREYNSRVLDGDNLERGRLALIALAEAWDNGTVPEQLRELRSMKQLVPLVRHGIVSNGYYHVASNHEYSDKSPAGLALQSLLDRDTKEQQAATRAKMDLEQLIDRVRFQDIPGFFPTPQPVINLMLTHASLAPGMRVLEPSAGIGSIADAARAITGDTVHCIEINHNLCEILRRKGYASTVQGDFLEVEPTVLYDRAVLNPPFEHGQDCDHVRHAFEFLRPGGRLVAIVSAGPFFREDRKSTEFREWLREMGADIIDLPADSFQGAGVFRTTGVQCKMVVVNKGVVRGDQPDFSDAETVTMEESFHEKVNQCR